MPGRNDWPTIISFVLVFLGLALAGSLIGYGGWHTLYAACLGAGIGMLSPLIMLFFLTVL